MSSDVEQEIPDDEPLLVVDITDHVIGRGSKPELHAARQWHRQSYVIILDSRSRVLLQRRSPRRQFDPGRWTTSVSGHVTGEDSYQLSAMREVREEIGAEPPELVYLGKVLAYSEAGGQLCGGPSAVFVGRLDRDISAFVRQEAEVVDIEWFDLDDIEQALTGGSPVLHRGKPLEFAQDFVPVFAFFLNVYRSSSGQVLRSSTT